MEELRAHLGQPDLQVSSEELAKVDLIAFIHAVRGRGTAGNQRRVVEVFESDGGAHQLTFRWLTATDTDTHEAHERVSVRTEATRLFHELAVSGVLELSAIRDAVNRMPT